MDFGRLDPTSKMLPPCLCRSGFAQAGLKLSHPAVCSVSQSFCHLLTLRHSPVDQGERTKIRLFQRQNTESTLFISEPF
ncbi:MAG TPA: hypothetical protein VEM15_02775, partial [Thermodesulfobacteriota bacterium]|nr:hypothetical protein [Thermodesulfobacteriota bacterium]